MAKSILLGALSPFAAACIYVTWVHGVWMGKAYTLFGAVYVSSDVLGLLTMLKRLPTSTFVHHICVVIFGSFSLFIDYASPDAAPWRNVGMLGAFSSLTFPVNTYLGLRRTGPHEWLRDASLAVYAPCIMLSLAWQLRNVEASFASAVYTVLAGSIFWDDYVLARFLCREESRASTLVFSAAVLAGGILSNPSLVACGTLGVAQSCIGSSHVPIVFAYAAALAWTVATVPLNAYLAAFAVCVYVVSILQFVTRRSTSMVENARALHACGLIAAVALRPEVAQTQ